MNVAKKIRNEFLSSLDSDSDRQKQALLSFIQSTNADEFIRTLPSGQSKIVALYRESTSKGPNSPRYENSEGLEQSN
jgi:hypothetical protein